MLIWKNSNINNKDMLPTFLTSRLDNHSWTRRDRLGLARTVAWACQRHKSKVACEMKTTMTMTIANHHRRHWLATSPSWQLPEEHAEAEWLSARGSHKPDTYRDRRRVDPMWHSSRPPPQSQREHWRRRLVAWIRQEISLEQLFCRARPSRAARLCTSRFDRANCACSCWDWVDSREREETWWSSPRTFETTYTTTTTAGL